MPLMQSTIDITLQIPIKMRGIFPNLEPLEIDLKAGIPKDVPEYVLKYYVKHRPHVYKKVEGSRVVEPDHTFEPEKPGKVETVDENPDEEVDLFEPAQFIEVNWENIKPAVKGLERKDLVTLAKFMKLEKNPYSVKSDVLVNKIVHDIAMKIKQQDEINKHEDAKEL